MAGKHSNAPEHRAEIIIQDIAVRHGFLVTVSLLVRNTGANSWDNRGRAPDRRYRLGFRLKRLIDSEGIVWEGRYVFRTESFAHGYAESVRFTIDSTSLAPGEYVLEVGVLLEQAFWFLDEKAPVVSKTLAIPAHTGAGSFDLQAPQVSGAGEERPSILFVAPSLPLFDREAGGKRLYEILRLLLDLNFRVTFLYEEEAPGTERYVSALEELGIAAHPEPLNFLACSARDCFQICICSFYECSARYHQALKRLFPSACLITDTVDVHWVRELRAYKSGIMELTAHEIVSRKRREVEEYRRAHLLWAATEEDRRAILDEVPSAKVAIVPVIQDREATYNPRRQGDIVLFVGNFKHAPNESAALWGAQICDEFSRQSGIPVRFHVVGAMPTKKILELRAQRNVEVFADVPSLESYYSAARVLLAPLRFGAGMKGKICEAVCFGVPVLTTSIGNEGIGLEDREEAFICDTTESFARALREIFLEHVDLSPLCEKALRRVVSICGREVVKRALADSLNAHQP